MSDDKEKLSLNQEEIIIYADYIAKIPISQTVKKTGLSESTINRRRIQLKQFLRKNVNLQKYQARIFGLYPLVINSLVHHLVNKDKDVTLKVAQSLGLLAKDFEEFKEILLAVAGNKSGDVNYNVVVNQFTAEQQELNNRNAASILDGLGASPSSRL